MPFAKDNLSINAMGGTEIMKYALMESIDASLLENFQIFVSRVQEKLSDQHIRILWLQDLAGDPAADHLKNNGWSKFHKLVFGTNWQMRGFIEMYNIPWSKCMVINNSINPIEFIEKPKDKIKLIYTPTPHRGLNILYNVFESLCKEYNNIELDVYSSFKLYGWAERDKEFTKLFDVLKSHPKVNYHGSVPNEELREALQKSHIFAYPSIWSETSCLCLMEAMSAGLVCIHPNYGALPETAGNMTFMYQMQDTLDDHSVIFRKKLQYAIESIDTFSEPSNNLLQKQKQYADDHYNRRLWVTKWNNFLHELFDSNPSRSLSSGQFFNYKTS
jgi:hypothetical protein